MDNGVPAWDLFHLRLRVWIHLSLPLFNHKKQSNLKGGGGRLIEIDCRDLTFYNHGNRLHGSS